MKKIGVRKKPLKPSQIIRIPKKIVIKGTVWTLVYKHGLHDPEFGLCDAYVDFNETVIYCEKSLPQSDKLKYILHEITHIILDEYNLHLSGGITDTFAEEAICAGIARTLLEIFTMRFREESIRATRRK